MVCSNFIVSHDRKKVYFTKYNERQQSIKHPAQSLVGFSSESSIVMPGVSVSRSRNAISADSDTNRSQSGSEGEVGSKDLGASQQSGGAAPGSKQL